MPKQDPATAKQFAALLKKSLSAFKGEDPPPRDPVAQLIVGFLEWNATRYKAENAFVALMDQMIDVNVYQENIFHTKMLLKDFDLDNYLFGAGKEDFSEAELQDIESRLRREMLEIFYSRNLD